jgi:hypothetical protein
MATGRGNYLTKQAGEYIVAAELSRLGFVATTFTGNVPSYDIVAVDDEGGHALVQVKAISADSWQFKVTQFAEVVFEGPKQIVRGPLPALYPDLICVMVRVASAGSDIRDRFYACPGSSWPGLSRTVTRATWRSTTAYAPSNRSHCTRPCGRTHSHRGRTDGT